MKDLTTPIGNTPKLLQSFTRGFDSVARNIWVILIPIALDLYLWLGPHLNLKKLLSPIFEESIRTLQQLNSPELSVRLDAVSEFWADYIARFNLSSALHTIPIGVPSLIAGVNPMESPIGQPTIIDINSALAALGLTLLFLVAGFLLGCFYFNLLARITQEPADSFDLRTFIAQVISTLGLLVGLFIIALMAMIPVMVFISIFSAINASLATFALFLLFFILLWAFLPMVFTPHSIYANQPNLIAALATSVRLVRRFLPGTSLFILTALLVGQGLDLLWRIPPASSWLTVVGIFGHAFIFSALYASSFQYFRSGIRWMNANVTERSSQEIRI